MCTIQNMHNLVLEINSQIQFRDAIKLEKHVRDHIVENRDENWRHILDSDLVKQVRFNYEIDNESQVVLDNLASEYQDLLSSEIQYICKSGKEHMHILEYEANENERETRVFIRAWWSEKRLIIIASANVSNGEVKTYYLKTGYVNTRMQSEEQFNRHTINRFRDYSNIQPGRAERCIAAHYGDDP
jgi:hypothetical protein